MRASQIWQWIYHRGARDFAAMTNLAGDYRGVLAERFAIARPEVVTRQVSADGTRKYLMRIAGGHEVETVYIPEEDRGTLCVSSQVGCTLTCTFCHTGTQRLVRNLTAAEIVGQVLVARDDLGEWGRKPDEKRLLSNIVLMGMGEPLYNFEAVRDAMKIAWTARASRSPPADHAVDQRRGAGDRPGRRGDRLPAGGVVPRDDRRDARQAGADQQEVEHRGAARRLRAYPRLSNAERITFEYVMLKGVNDSDADARRLVKLIAGIPAKINLIPFNPWPGAPYERSDPERIEAFAAIVNRAGYASPVRTPRGEDIMAACGQLKSASERARAGARLRGHVRGQAGNPADI